MGFKKMLIGEPVPDKDDPKYKEKHEKAVDAGMSFAKAVRLDKAAACVQRFATNHTKLFLALVFGFVLFSVTLNLWRMSNAVSHREANTSSAIERQEHELHLKRHHQEENAMREKYKQMYENRRNNDNLNTLEEYEAFGKD